MTTVTSRDGTDHRLRPGGDFGERLEQLVSAGRNGHAVEFLLTSAGVSPDAEPEVRAEPSWRLFEAVAPTLVYDRAA